MPPLSRSCSAVRHRRYSAIVTIERRHGNHYFLILGARANYFLCFSLSTLIPLQEYGGGGLGIRMQIVGQLIERRGICRQMRF